MGLWSRLKKHGRGPGSSAHPPLSLADKGEALVLASRMLKAAHDLSARDGGAALERELRSARISTPTGQWLRDSSLHAIGAGDALRGLDAVGRLGWSEEALVLSAQLSAGLELSCAAPALDAWAQAMNRARERGLARWPNALSLAAGEARALGDLLSAMSPQEAGARRL